jgi:signal transduction histidine kinase
MSLRLRLFLTLVLISLFFGGFYAGVSYFSFARTLWEDIQGDLDLGASLAREALRLDPSGRPYLARPEVLWRIHYPMAIRVYQGDQVVLEAGLLDPPLEDWLSRDFVWEGYKVVVFLQLGQYVRALRNAAKTLLLPVPFLLLLVLVLSFLAARALSDPLRRLTQATGVLAEALEAGRPLPPTPFFPTRDEVGQLAETFARLRQALLAALERERAFTRFASHQLRTPLAVLRTHLAVLKEGLLPPEEVLGRLEAALARAEATLSALLALARASSPQREVVSLEGFLREVFPECRLRGRGDLLVLGDPDLLRQVLENLRENALRYGAPPYEAHLEAQGSEAVLRIRDHGPGVPAEDLVRLGEPFFRKGRGEGYGLGLAFVRRALEAMGGGVVFRSSGEGLEVEVRLPLAAEA